MSLFKRTPAFEKDYKRLRKKYRSLDGDLEVFEALLAQYPEGTGSKFAILHRGEEVMIVKARLACRALRESSLRIIYAYHGSSVTFMYIELYFKGDQECEDQERIRAFLKTWRE